MIKTLKVLVISALTLACLYVALIFILGVSGFSRYRPDLNEKEWRRYPPPPSRYHPDRDEKQDPAVDEEMTENETQKESLPETAVSRNS